jgi:2-oxoglutarate ferredoxin oxidoreductase subunit gamma
VHTTRKVDARQVELPMYAAVMESIGTPIVFNICVLGALLGITELVRPESVLQAIKERVPADSVEVNSKAFRLGLGLGRPFRR